MTVAGALVGIYLIGVVMGLAVMRDSWPSRLVTAALWPLGLVAFAAVLVVLLSATVYLWPIPALVTVALIAAVFLAF